MQDQESTIAAAADIEQRDLLEKRISEIKEKYKRVIDSCQKVIDFLAADKNSLKRSDFEEIQPHFQRANEFWPRVVRFPNGSGLLAKYPDINKFVSDYIRSPQLSPAGVGDYSYILAVAKNSLDFIESLENGFPQDEQEWLKRQYNRFTHKGNATTLKRNAGSNVNDRVYPFMSFIEDSVEKTGTAPDYLDFSELWKKLSFGQLPEIPPKLSSNLPGLIAVYEILLPELLNSDRHYLPRLEIYQGKERQKKENPYNILFRYPSGNAYIDVLRAGFSEIEKWRGVYQDKERQDEALNHLCGYYQRVLLAHPYVACNNAMAMTHVNACLELMGLEPVPHGLLDFVVTQLQPQEAANYFKLYVTGKENHN